MKAVMKPILISMVAFGLVTLVGCTADYSDAIGTPFQRGCGQKVGH